MNLLDIIPNLIAGILLFILGWITKTLKTIFQNQIRQKKIKLFFGKSSIKKEKVLIICPLFNPLTYDEFNKQKDNTRMKKKVDLKETSEVTIVPIQDDVIVLEDLQAMEVLVKLFFQYGMKPPLFAYDNEKYNLWKEKPCRICIGSPRSNNVLQNAFEMDIVKKTIQFSHPTHYLDSFTLVIDNITYNVTEKWGIGVIIKIPNPTNKNDAIIGIFGCRGETTRATSEFLQLHFPTIIKNIKKIKKKTKNLKELIIILISFKIDKLKKATAPEIMYVGTKSKTFDKSNEIMKNYIRSK